MEVVLMPLEDGMFADLQRDEQVAGRAAVRAGLAFLGETKLRPVIDAGRNIDFELALAAHITLTAALLAGPPDNLSPAAALRAGTADRKERLLIDHLAASAAGGAGDQAILGFGAFAFAAPANKNPT